MISAINATPPIMLKTMISVVPVLDDPLEEYEDELALLVAVNLTLAPIEVGLTNT